MKSLVWLLFSLLVAWSSAKSTGPNLLELKAKLNALGRSGDLAQGQLQLQQLQSVQDLSNLLDEGRQKLAATRLVFEQTPAATPAAATPAAATPAAATPTTAAGAATTTTGSADSPAAVDLIQPPQLQPLALPSYGPQMQIDELSDIQREQNSLREKKVLVGQQERSIQEAQDNASKLEQLIAVNKQIAQRNEQALVAAQQHLTDRIKAYGDRLAKEAAGTASAASGGGSGAASGASAAALIEASDETTQTISTDASQSTQFQQFQADIQQRLKEQADNMQRLQDMLLRKRRHRRHRRSQALQGENNNDDDDDDNESEDGEDTKMKPVTVTST